MIFALCDQSFTCSSNVIMLRQDKVTSEIKPDTSTLWESPIMSVDFDLYSRKFMPETFFFVIKIDASVKMLLFCNNFLVT